jgi:basic membrane protein A
LLFVLPVAAIVVAAVAIWTVATAPSPAPTATPTASSTRVANTTTRPTSGPSRPASTSTPNPNATPRPVRSIVLVSAIGQDADGTPSNLAWQAVQEAGDGQGAKTSRVQPLTRTELTGGIAKAAEGGATIVVAVGPEATQAVLAAGSAHPDVVFLLLGAGIPSDAPANVHAVVFDEGEAGYLAGMVAASVSDAKKVGFVGDVQGDASSAGFAAGFTSGVQEGDTSAVPAVAYAGRIGDPQHGGSAATILLKAGADVVSAMAGLSGDGALRTACAAGAKVVAVDTDASLILPDLNSCLVVSVLFHYDVAVSNAIAGYAAGDDLPATIVGDVSNGCIGLSSFHKEVSQDVQDRIAIVLDVLEAGPPRQTPGPTEAAPSPSKKP